MKLTLIPFSILCILFLNSASAADNTILVQSTTSTKNSGFYDYILPKFQAETGIIVKVVAVGTGAAIKNARNCDADILLVHSPEHEQKFVADGYADPECDIPSFVRKSAAIKAWASKVCRVAVQR